jgi:hypothetical protein
MSWMDLSDYLVIEETAAARIDDLRGDAASRATEISAPAPAPAPPARVSACDWLRPASIEAP